MPESVPNFVVATDERQGAMGAMGAIVRDLDWSKTSLGPQSSWSQALRATVNTCLNSRLPILILWGVDRIAIYNDAYRPMLGAKHPRSLGRQGSECWPEAWTELGPKLQAVVSQGKVSWSENQLIELERDGALEERYFTFSYSPIRRDSGAVDGISCAVTETTAQVLGERRSRMLDAVSHAAEAVRTVDDACRFACAAMAENPADLPFALIYIVEDPSRAPHLAAATGVVGEDPGADERLNARGDWPLDRVLRSGLPELVEGKAFVRSLGALRSSATVAPKAALLVPFASPIADSADIPTAVGVLVVGLSPTLTIDQQYRGFLETVAARVAQIVAGARDVERGERRRTELAAADRAKTDFFSNVSHEFRTPLTLMIGPTEQALASSERVLRGADLELVHRNELRLLKLVNTLLDFSRMETKRVDVSFEKTDIALLTKDIASTFRSAFERAGLNFDVRCEAIEHPVYVDRDMWEKIVLNLLSNAFKFTFEGGVFMSLYEQGDLVVLTVQDSGVGIPAAKTSRVFERFQRIEGARSRNYEGSGIGLALVRDLVRLHLGDITLESIEGKGSAFTVSIRTGREHLPADRIRAPKETSLATNQAQSFANEALSWLPSLPAKSSAGSADDAEFTRAMRTSDARILVVDDNSDMRDYLSRVLGRQWQVTVVADGAEALSLARRAAPTLVLTDLMMPNLDGLALIRALRSDPRTAAVVVLVLSARAGEDSRVMALAAGADDFLIKPFSTRDLLTRVTIHLELGKLRQAAEIGRRRLYSLFAEAPAGIAVLRGQDFEFELTNARYEQIMRRSQLVGKTVARALPELEGQTILETLRQVYRTGKRFVGRDFLIRLPSEPGGELEDVFFDFVYEPFHAGTGAIDGVTCVALDVTQRVRGAQERDRLMAEREQLLRNECDARRDAEQAVRAKDEFLAMLGHELRNPLAPIVTALQLLRLRGNDAAEREHTIMERQAQHLTTLVDDLLDVSRITQGKIELKREPVELSCLVARAIEIVGPILEQRKHHLTLEVAASGLCAFVDATRFAQVISNLLSNAAKYTPPGGQIWVTASAARGELTLRVTDNGMGIAQAMLPHVFELFMQERQASDRAGGGLGLGLAIVRSLVQMHGGKVRAESPGLGCGSSFTVSMPQALPGQTPSQPPSVVARLAGRPAVRRVLIVDDNADAAELLARTMESFGCETEIAHDGPSALQFTDIFQPQLALLDIGLPLMDGYELARCLREKHPAHELTLVAVTGYGQKGDIEQALAAGFDEHLTKPVDIQRLKAMI